MHLPTMTVQSTYRDRETEEFAVDIKWNDRTTEEGRHPRHLAAAFPEDSGLCPCSHHDMIYGETDCPTDLCYTLLGAVKELRRQAQVTDDLLNYIYHLSSPMARGGWR